MNILILTLYPAPYRIELFEKLSENHNITVFFEKDNDNRNPLYCQTSDKFKYYILGNEKADAVFGDAVKNLKSYDLVMFYEFSTKLSGKLILKCITKGVKYAINCDGAVSISTEFPKKQIKTFFIKHAAYCFAGGEKAKEYFKTYGARDERITIHNFTSIHDYEIISPLSDNDKQELRQTLGLEGKTVSVSVGQFIKRKRFDLLIDVWKNIPEDNMLYIIGDGPLKAKLLDQINANGIKNIKILDFMVREKLFEYYKAADLFVFTTIEDIWGLVINEALAKGLPVVSIDRCTCAAEIIKDGFNGYIVNEEEREKMISDFTEKISAVLENDDFRKQLSENASESAKPYCYEKMAQIVKDKIEGK